MHAGTKEIATAMAITFKAMAASLNIWRASVVFLSSTNPAKGFAALRTLHVGVAPCSNIYITISPYLSFLGDEVEEDSRRDEGYGEVDGHPPARLSHPPARGVPSCGEAASVDGPDVAGEPKAPGLLFRQKDGLLAADRADGFDKLPETPLMYGDQVAIVAHDGFVGILVTDLAGGRRGKGVFEGVIGAHTTFLMSLRTTSWATMAGMRHSRISIERCCVVGVM